MVIVYIIERKLFMQHIVRNVCVESVSTATTESNLNKKTKKTAIICIRKHKIISRNLHSTNTDQCIRRSWETIPYLEE